MQVSSVLYTVQRMTLLSSLFTILACIQYVFLRKNEHDLGIGWKLLVAFSLISTVILGVLSKENAALSFVFFLLIETTFLSPNQAIKNRARSVIYYGFCLLPLTLGVLIFLFNIDIFFRGYVTRDFTVADRILSQGPILVLYLKNILVPVINNFYFYWDHINHETYSTLQSIFSILAHITLIALSIFTIARRKPEWSIAGFGVLWFYCAHLLESTVLPLELAFEHRNYLGLFGIAISFVVLAKMVFRYVQPKVRYLLTIILILFLTSTTLLRALWWSDSVDFIMRQSKLNPKSLRVKSEEIGMALTMGDQRKAQFELQLFASISPGDSRIPALEMLGLCATPQLVLAHEVEEITRKATNYSNHVLEGSRGWHYVLDMTRPPNCKNLSAGDFLKVVEPITKSHQYALNPTAYRGVLMWTGVLQANNGEVVAALNTIENAKSIAPSDPQYLVAQFRIAFAARLNHLARAYLDELKELDRAHPYAVPGSQIKYFENQLRKTEAADLSSSPTPVL